MMLTDAEINRITFEQWGPVIDVHPAAHRAYARAIIAAHTAKLLAGVEKTEPVEFWTVAHGWVKVDEVKQHFDSVGCATIYAKEGEEREPLYTADQLQQYAAAAAAKAREKALSEAKRVCEEVRSDSNGEKYDMFGSNLAEQCANAIKKLKVKQ